MNDTQPRRRSRMAMRAQNTASSVPAADMEQAVSSADSVIGHVAVEEPTLVNTADATNTTPNSPVRPRANVFEIERDETAQSAEQDSSLFSTSTSPYVPIREKAPWNPQQQSGKPSSFSGSSPYAPVVLPLQGSDWAANQHTADFFSAKGSFAPPHKLSRTYTSGSDMAQSATGTGRFSPVHNPENRWADDDALSQESAYRTQSDVDEAAASKKSRFATIVLILLCVALLLAGLAILFQDQIASLVGYSYTPAQPEPVVVSTTAPKTDVQAYHATESEKASESAAQEIGSLLENVSAEQYLVTENNVIMRSEREDGFCDFYVFSESGKLLCYFEKLNADDFQYIGENLYHVEQYPYLITSAGKAAVNLKQVSGTLVGEPVLGSLCNGWSIITDSGNGEKNYINAEGTLLSPLWFSKAYPFTGAKTLAYVDTKVAGDSQYLLYVLSADGTEERWSAFGKLTDVVTSACGTAYMDNGEFYFLDKLSAPECTTDNVSIYLNCDAIVLRNPESGKYALYVHGQQQYGFEYDSIRPVESDLSFCPKVCTGSAGDCTIYTVNQSYPLPKAYSFILEKNGGQEYVSLSSGSIYPICLNDAF